MTATPPQPPVVLDAWLAALAAELELDPEMIPVATVLDMTRDVAHSVARPAAPLSALLIGLAAARSGTAALSTTPAEAITAACETASKLAVGWADRAEHGGHAPSEPERTSNCTEER